jgi:hypothetical protein
LPANPKALPNQFLKKVNSASQVLNQSLASHKALPSQVSSSQVSNSQVFSSQVPLASLLGP